MLTDRILVPVANEEDARRTFGAVLDTLISDVSPSSVIIAAHVIEKAGGAPDKAPLPARQEQAEATLSLLENLFQQADSEIETEVAYGTDVVETLCELAMEKDATAIVFVPRPSGRLTRLLSGDLSARLIVESPVPVLTLPQPAEEG